MQINKKGTNDKLPVLQNTVICPICNCEFVFEEKDIEVVVEGIPYEKGIRKLLGMNQNYIYHKYILCPWCHSKHKLIYDLLNSGEVVWWNK